MAYHVLCIDDDAEFLLTLKIQLKKNFPVSTAQNLTEGMEVLEDGGVDLVLLDVRLGAENGIDGLNRIKSEFPAVDVVMLSGNRDPKLIVAALRSGASDYLCKPFAHDELLAVIERTQKLKCLRDKNDELVMDLKSRDMARPLIGESKAFKTLLERVRCVRGHGANVLIEGESGTGKELVARFVHELEGDGSRPFIAVNCAAIPETLIESELFGHEKGAFSGAFQRKIGKFELAGDGDIFLDEINSLKPDLQAKILRVLQEKEIYRVGGNVPIRCGFRVIAATNADLGAMVSVGAFRMDLFHRLRVVSFKIPPLRDRPEDIPVLVAHFLAKHGVKGKPREFAPDAMEKIMRYAWPGNARELENLVHSLIIMAPGAVISVRDLPAWLDATQACESLSTAVPAVPVSREERNGEVQPLKRYVQRAEIDYIREVIRLKEGDKAQTARLLGISRTSLYEKLKVLNSN